MRIVGADTAYPVTDALVDEATRVMGQAPAFWGRYFTSPTETGDVEYRHALESAVLAARQVRVLPIARQTNDVGGNANAGFRDGAANVADLVQTFGADRLAAQCPGGACLFLDVEGSGASRLSADYYSGWVRGLASTPTLILPCIYGIPGDAVTWTALARAVAGGAACYGLWLAEPLLTAPEPVAWRDTVKPSVDPGVPTVLWQYCFPRDGAAIDRSQVNPAIDAQAALLDHLVLPTR